MAGVSKRRCDEELIKLYYFLELRINKDITCQYTMMML